MRYTVILRLIGLTRCQSGAWTVFPMCTATFSSCIGIIDSWLFCTDRLTSSLLAWICSLSPCTMCTKCLRTRAPLWWVLDLLSVAIKMPHFSRTPKLFLTSSSSWSKSFWFSFSRTQTSTVALQVLVLSTTWWQLTYWAHQRQPPPRNGFIATSGGTTGGTWSGTSAFSRLKSEWCDVSLIRS